MRLFIDVRFNADFYDNSRFAINSDNVGVANGFFINLFG